MFKKLLVIAATVVVILLVAISTFIIRALGWEELAITERLNAIPLVQHELKHIRHIDIHELDTRDDTREVLIELHGSEQNAQLVGVINTTDQPSEYEFTGHLEINGQSQPVNFIYSGISNYSGHIKYTNGDIKARLEKHDSD